jgi:hypothetical protein
MSDPQPGRRGPVVVDKGVFAAELLRRGAPLAKRATGRFWKADRSLSPSSPLPRSASERTSPAGGAPRLQHLEQRLARARIVWPGPELEQWQVEVTAGGRIWYCIDDDRRTVWMTAASVGHPKATE